MSKLTDKEIRNDSEGGGNFGDPRGGGTRTHKGTDYVVEVGEDILSPVQGVVTKIGFPYADDLSYRYVRVTDKYGYDHRFYYVEPREGLMIGLSIVEGTLLGTSQDLSKRHGTDMIQHVHYEILTTQLVAISQLEYDSSYNGRSIT